MSVRRISELDSVADAGERLGVGATSAIPSITVGANVDPFEAWAFRLGFRIGLAMRKT